MSEFLGLPHALESLLKKESLEAHEAEGAKIRLQLELHQVAMRILRQLYQHANPIDEWVNLPAGTAQEQIQPDYSLERIEAILAIVPAGVTSMTLTLGQRTIPLYAGAALATSQVVNPNNLGIILTENDKRIVQFTGTSTQPSYVGLMGHVLERTGHK